MSSSLYQPSYAILICSCAKNEFLAFHTLYRLSLIPILWRNAQHICIISPSSTEASLCTEVFTLNQRKVTVLRPYDEGVGKSIQKAISLLDAEYIFFNMDDRPVIRYSNRLLLNLFTLLDNVSPDCVRLTRDGPLARSFAPFGAIGKATLYRTSLTNTFFKKTFIQNLLLLGDSIWSIDKYGPPSCYTSYAPGLQSIFHPPISCNHLLQRGKILELPNDGLMRDAISSKFLKHSFIYRLYNSFFRLLSPFVFTFL